MRHLTYEHSLDAMTRLLLTLLIAFVPLAKSQDAVVLAEVKVPLTETTYFCYNKAVTGFNPPYDKTGFELLI